jgi:hypothetical protein
VIGDHTCLTDLQDSLILIADEFLYPGIILAEVTNVVFARNFQLVEKTGTDEVLLLNTRYRGVFIFRIGICSGGRIPIGQNLIKKVAHPTAAPLKNASAISHQSFERPTP